MFGIYSINMFFSCNYLFFKITKKLLITIFCLISIVISASITIGQPLSNTAYSIAEFEKLIKSNNGDRGVYMGLCYLYSREKQYDKMLNIMHTIVRKFKNDNTVLFAFIDYSKNFYNNRHYDLAEDIAKLTMSYNKKDPSIALIYSDILLKKNKLDENIHFLRSFIKDNPDEYALYYKLIDSYIYKTDYKGAFDIIKSAQDYNLEEIYYYLLEAAVLQNIDLDKSKSYYQAYLEKLSIANDFNYRINSAKTITKTLFNKNSNESDYINLIEYLKTQKTPLSIILIQARYAHNLFPYNPYFESCISDIYNNIGIYK